MNRERRKTLNRDRRGNGEGRGAGEGGKSDRAWSFVLNLIAPGAGLVTLQRVPLGIALAVLFAVLAQLAVMGLFVIPAHIPPTLAYGASVGAAATWSIAQWAGWRQARLVLGPANRRELQLLHDAVAAALDEHRFPDAEDLLRVAMRIDDEDVRLHLLRARLAMLTDRVDIARVAWRRVTQLDTAGKHREEATNGLEWVRDRQQDLRPSRI